jgi:nucleotide-binding universal stress UspA family protein
MKVQPAVQEGPVKVKRILAPTDFSPGAEAAVRWAIALGKAFGAEVTLLNVMDLRLPVIADLPGEMAMAAMPDLLEQVRTESAVQTKKLAARFPGAKTLLREGIPRSMILQVGGEIGADLIVMGTHGRTGLAHVFFGSVAEHVVRHSTVPVLTVRQRNE